MSASPEGWPPADWPLPIVELLRDAGLGVLGVIAAGRYDALVPRGWRCEAHLPGARSVLVIGSGGGRLAEAALGSGGPDPVDRATVAAVGRAVDAWRVAGEDAVALHGFERRGPSGRVADADAGFADFVALGREAGLGVPSRLRLLLHPVFGPWLAIRSVVLTGASLTPTPPLEGFAPCDGCPAPCRGTCPAGALDDGPLDWRCCRDERLAGGPCATHCFARYACPVGAEHAHATGVEAHFMRASLHIALESQDFTQVDRGPAD